MEEQQPVSSVFECKRIAATDNAEQNINKQILELKKKIQLSEGQRKALFEERDAERKACADEILRLKRDIAMLQCKLRTARGRLEPLTWANGSGAPAVGAATAVTDATAVAVAALGRRYPELVGKSLEKVRMTLDLRIIDLQKQLDVLRHSTKKKDAYMRKLADEYQILLLEDTSKKSLDKVFQDHPVSKKLISLENEIHRMSVQATEASHIRTKYRAVRAGLVADSVRFESALQKLEEHVQDQQKEIEHLQKVSTEALEKRDNTRSTLENEQSTALNTVKAHERQLVDSRKRVEQRRVELERLERRIAQQAMRGPAPAAAEASAVAPLATDAGGLGAGGGGVQQVEQDVGSEREDTLTEEDTTAQETDFMENAFAKLKDASGALDPDEVFIRFKKQRHTFERLMFLRKNSEEEKTSLENAKERMTAELELFKFAEVKDKEQSIEDLEQMDKRIESQKERLIENERIHEEKLEVAYSLCSTLHSLCVLLRCVADENDLNLEEPLPDLSTADKIIEMLEERVAALYKKEEGIYNVNNAENILKKKVEKNVPTAINGDRLPHSYMALTAKSPVSVMGIHSTSAPVLIPSEDEEEVPSRDYLKRQAQVLVDAKSRRKNFRIQMPRRK